MNKKPFFTATRIGWTIVAVLIVAIIGSIVYEPNSAPITSDKAYNNPIALGPTPLPLPEEAMSMEFKLLDGQVKKLSDYKGKVLLVNLWATWCGPCRMEIPDLIVIGNEYKSKGVEIVGLTSTEDSRETPERVNAFVKNFKINYAIGWADGDLASILNEQGVIPQSLIIGRDGKLKRVFRGFDPRRSPPKIRAALDEALK